MIAQALGGIGLFLVGMVLVTDGLRAAAGDALRRALLRFTGGPIKALVSGAVVTALVQSSSATTVATIGFVGAGLLTFQQALGIVFGANIGTTATGWIVALLGLKFSVSTVALPLVGVGALVRLFARGRLAHVGLALSGFGIIFVGIDVLQGGMEGLSDRLTPAELPQDTWPGRLLLVVIGTLLTTVMQSSSAAVATTLTALHAGTISLHQAAAMVIGINIGTTVTAGIAALGASTAAKRTAFGHLLFNAITGAVAFAGLPLFVWIIGSLGSRIAAGDATVLLASFHTAFNVLGVLLVLPFMERFAAIVTCTIRHRGPHLTRLLDPASAAQGALAAEAVRQTAIEILGSAVTVVGDVLSSGSLTQRAREDLDSAAAALAQTEEYVAKIHFPVPLSEEGHKRHLSTIHALDHLGRVVDVAGRHATHDLSTNGTFGDLLPRLQSGLRSIAEWTRDAERSAPTDALHHLLEDIREARRQIRADLLSKTSLGQISPADAGQRLEQLRWLEDVTHHLWRVTDRLRGERLMGSIFEGA